MVRYKYPPFLFGFIFENCMGLQTCANLVLHVYLWHGNGRLHCGDIVTWGCHFSSPCYRVSIWSRSARPKCLSQKVVIITVFHTNRTARRLAKKCGNILEGEFNSVVCRGFISKTLITHAHCMAGGEWKKRHNRYFASKKFGKITLITDFHSTGIRMTARCLVYWRV